MYVCVICNSWFASKEELSAHKSRKECRKFLIKRAEEKKAIRLQCDAERKARLEGVPIPTEPKEETKVTVKEKVVKEVKPIIKEANITKEIENKVESEDETFEEVINTETSNDIIEDNTSDIKKNITDEDEKATFDVVAFKAFLVKECNIKVQKISRMGEENLVRIYAEFLPAFMEAVDKLK